VRSAIDAGWRLIDTAAIYGNEAGVGKAVQTCGLPRKDLFVTTKIWNDSHGYDAALKAFEASLERLALDYVDLCLIHWPVPQLDLYPETWKAMIQLRDEGRIKSIGVSNFHIDHIQRLLDETGKTICINKPVKGAHRLDGKALAAEHPDLYDRYIKEGAAQMRFTFKN